MNWYAYCGGNPIKFVDPSGTMSVEQFIGVFVPTYALHSYVNAQYASEIAVLDSVKILYGMYSQIQDALSEGITFKDVTDQLAFLARSSVLPFTKEQLGDTIYVFEHLYYFDQGYAMSNDEVKEFGIRAGQIGKEIVRVTASTYLWVNSAVNLAQKASKAVSASKSVGSKLFNSLNDYIVDPKKLGNATPAQMYKYLQDNGYNPQPLSGGGQAGKLFTDGGGFKVNWGGDRILQYHPSGLNHHGGGEYFKISSGSTGTQWFNLDGTPLITK